MSINAGTPGTDSASTSAKRGWLGFPSGLWDVLGLLTAYLAVQSRFLLLPRIYDPLEYFFISSRLGVADAFHRSLRIGLTIPVRLIQELVGYSELGYYLFPILGGMGLTVATYYLGRNLFSRLVGWVGAAVVSLSPLILSSSSQLFPDLPAAAAFTGAMALIAGCGIRYKANPTIDRRAMLMLLGAGFLLGWAYLIREFVVILFPVVVIVALVYRLPFRSYLYICGAALAMFGVEMIWGWWRYQDPLVRLGDLMSTGEPSEVVQARWAESNPSTLTKLLTFPRILGLDIRGVLLLTLGGFGIAVAAKTRDRSLLSLAAWSTLYWALLMVSYIFVDEFGRGTLRANVPRYWYPILPAFVLGGIGGIHVVGERLGHRLRANALIAGVGGLVVALGLLSVAGLENSARYPAEFHDFREWLAETGEEVEVIWSDQRTSWLLPFYTKTPFGEAIWDGEVRAFNTARRFRPPEEVTGGLMVYHDWFFRTRLSGWKGAVPAGYVDPAPEWVPVFVSAGSDVVVYGYNADVSPTRVITVDDESIVWSRNGVRIPGTRGGDPTMEMTGDQPVVVSLSTADDAPISSAITDIANQGAVRITLDLEVGADVWVDFQCEFEPDAPSSRRVVKGTTLYHPDHQAPRVEYVCAVPPGVEPPLDVLPRLVFTGVGQVDLGSAEIDWFPAAG